MMKKLVKVMLSLSIVISVYADVVVSETKVVLPVDINTAKIKFTNLGYGDNFLVKVIVPELAKHTLLNHRNVGEDGPCLFTYDAGQVSDVVQNNPEVLDVEFTIKHTRSTWIFDNVCKVTLVEIINANIRGFNFTHVLEHALPDRVVADCL